MARILVVDDEKDLQDLIRQKFRKKIKNEEYSFLFALNGREALETIDANHDIDIVLSDINMPEMDGLTLLSNLKERNELLKTVIVSAYGDMKNLRVAMNRGAFDFVTKPIDFEDLELTIQKTLEHVDSLRRTISALKENNIMKLYVDDTVLNFMSGKEFESAISGNELINASVAFIDICKFTSISEQIKPDELVNLLNTYFEVIVKEILDHDGYVDKFIGDAVMAVFRGDQHEMNAAKCALAIRNDIERLESNPLGLNYSPQVSIGINSGEMVSGNIGSSSLKRLDYTVLGDVVNTAQRLQSAAEDGQILVNAHVNEIVNEVVKTNHIGAKPLKNKANPVELFEILH
jgi:class 3 adenylate cyclase